MNHEGPHDACDPDTCFAAKLRYMARGGLAMNFTYGKADFHGPTVRERAEQQVREARAAGYDPQPAGARWV